MIIKLYPQGKKKAFCLSYDDGALEDVRFVSLLNKYNLKATFNLNSGLMESEFERIHETGKVVKRLSFEKAKHLYDGHEIASHSFSHPYLHEMNFEQVTYEMIRDKILLERHFSRQIYGFALPFDTLTPLIQECARNSRFEYLRSSTTTNSYTPSADYFNFEAGIFHLDLKFDDYINGFFETEEELATCQIIGHSYDLEVNNLWDKIELVLSKLANYEDAICLTSIELVRYLKAIRTVTITEKSIINASNETLWFNIDGKIISVLPKSKILL